MARQFVSDVADDTGAGCPQWMSDGDRATVNVHFRGIQLWPEVQAGEALRGELLVQLDDVDVCPGLARLGQRPVRCFDGGDAEHVRVVTRNTARDDSRQGLGPDRRLLRPDDTGAFSDPMMRAPAPSVSGEELPAVTVPSARNAGLSAARAPREASPRMPSSRSSAAPETGITSPS